MVLKIDIVEVFAALSGKTLVVLITILGVILDVESVEVLAASSGETPVVLTIDSGSPITIVPGLVPEGGIVEV